MKGYIHPASTRARLSAAAIPAGTPRGVCLKCKNEPEKCF